MIEKYNKITPGFITQIFEKQHEKFVCVDQGFTASDQVDREDEKGEPVDIDTQTEEYQPFNMVQPGRDYYFLHVHAGVEAENIGPFSTEQERSNALEKHRENKGREEYDSYFAFNVVKGSTVDF
jgi:hypothetical protein